MTSGLRLAVCATTIVCAGLGCSHTLENRAIKAFSTALAGDDLGDLKQATSNGFQSKALRSTEAIDDLEILKLPTGGVSIVSVEDESETEKAVTVKVGDSKQKLLYKLVKSDDDKWVVDDIYVRQRRRGHVATRSVTEQMDLLLSVREFIDAWSDGDREDVLKVTGPELRQVLNELPPAYLARMTERITGEKDQSSRKPDAQLDGDRALVTLPRTSGKLLVSYRLHDDGAWRVSDVALESRREAEHVPSLLKRATALATAVRFLESYNADDKEQLAAVTTTNFFERSLKASDLTALELPRPALAADTYELTMQAHRADFVIPTAADVVKVSLVRQDDEDARGLPPVYRVEETTVYEDDGQQEKRLSSLFTAHGSMQVFAEALRERNLAILRHTSTPDFNRRVWDRLKGLDLEHFPLADVANTPPKVINTVFKGELTEITVSQGPRAMTYVLRGRDSDLLVDDVLVPQTGRPSSLKSTLEHVTPAFLLAHGITAQDVSVVRRSVSDDFNRLVWGQSKMIPQSANVAPRFIAAPPTAITQNGDRSLVVLGSDNHGARISLVKERGYLVVDEVLMIDGPEPDRRIGLKQVLRSEVARRLASAAPVVPPNRVTMTHTTARAPSKRDALDAALPAGESLPAAEPLPISEPMPQGPPASAPKRATFRAPVELTPDLGDLRFE